MRRHVEGHLRIAPCAVRYAAGKAARGLGCAEDESPKREGAGDARGMAALVDA